jgi:predicted naringenin-chalcone synthase
MKVLILALATALPQYSADQTALGQKLIDGLSLEGEEAQFVERLHARTAIKRRYSVVSDIEKAPEQFEFWSKSFIDGIPGTEARNDKYREEAPVLALKAAKALLQEWQRDAKEITHIISISCTGVMAPGIEFILQQELGLLPTVRRLGINFMGCFGAFCGLATAAALARENPKNRILVVCTELCSLHFQVSLDPEVFIGNVLFGDGAAAVLVGCEARDKEKPLWSIEQSQTNAFEQSRDIMTWSLSDHGCVMSIGRGVPKIIEKRTQEMLRSVVRPEQFSDYTWAIHPGGKAIVEAVERSCNLSKKQTAASWSVLEKYGNMSSATFLFVLKELAQEIDFHPHVIGLGFGPGLSMESIILERPKPGAAA